MQSLEKKAASLDEIVNSSLEELLTNEKNSDEIITWINVNYFILTSAYNIFCCNRKILRSVTQTLYVC